MRLIIFLTHGTKHEKDFNIKARGLQGGLVVRKLNPKSIAASCARFPRATVVTSPLPLHHKSAHLSRGGCTFSHIRCRRGIFNLAENMIFVDL